MALSINMSGSANDLLRFNVKQSEPVSVYAFTFTFNVYFI